MNHSTNKKRGNLFQANQSLVSSASQKTQKTSNTQIAASSKQNSKAKITPNNLKEETKDKMNATLNSKSSIASQQQFNKYEQKIMNIDLSQISNTTGNSNGKRANLFNEKSTSRERIYTRKTVQGHYDQAQNQNEIDLYNTPSFNIRVDKNNTPSFNIRVDKNALRSNQNQQNEMLNLNNFIEESKNQQQQQKQILQDFPFLQAQKTLNLPYQNLSQPQIVKGSSGGMNDDENSEEEKEIRDLQSVTSQNLLSQDYFNPFSKKSQPNFMSMNNNTPQANSVMQTRNQNNHGLGANFFDGLETVSQSQVSYSPRFNANNNRREETNLDLNLSEIDHNADTKSFKTAMGSQNVMHRQYQSGNKSQLTNSRNLGLHQDNTSDEFLSAIQGDDTLHLDDNQLPRNSYQNNNSQLIIPNDLQLSRIDHKNDQYQISLDDLSGVNAASGFNRKEERVKNQILQFVLDRILYEQVIPQMIQDMARSSILNFQTLNKSNQIILTQKADEIYNDDILPKVLVQFLNEFMNVTDQSHAAEKALKKYVDENVIENVNFILCSEIWNDCLLIPHLMKEDPNICVSNMINDFTMELVIDLYNNRANFQQVEKSKQQQQLVPQSYAVKPKKEKVNSSQFSNNFEIHKYVEDNLVQNFVIEEVEDIVINIMQEIQFQSKKIPQIISQEIYDDLLQDQIRVTSQQVMKKERLLIKGADSFFQMFIQEEMGDLIIEVIESSKISPQKYSEDAVTQVQEKLIQQMFRECSVKAENQMIQKKIVHEMVDVQMDMLITSLVQVNLVQIKNDQIAQQRSIDTLISDVIFNQISDVIFDAMKNEKKLIIDSENVMEQLVQDQVVLLAQEGIDDEIAQEEYDGIIDKIIEFDIWRDTVKDLKLEEEGIFALLEDWTDAFTGEFFIDNFTEIKNEYLRGYKEQITKLENESTIIPQQQQIQNISYNIISNHSRKNDYQVQSLNTSQRVDGMNNTRFYDIASQSGHKGNQSKIASFRGASAIGRKMSSTNSNNQFLNNTSQFQSVNSDGFYDCNNENFIDAEEQEIIKDFEHRITQQEQAYGQGNYGNQAVDNSIIKLNKIQSDFDFNEELEFQMERQSDYSQTKKNIQKVQANYLKQPTFETQTDIMDETLQNLEIDEGTMKSPHHQNYYIIPQIKSLDFLNIRQMNFKNYFQSSKIISNSQQVQRANAPVMLPVDSQAIDVLCVNCYECVKFDEVDIHSIECLKNQELLMNSKIQSPDKNSIYDYYMHKQSSGVKEVSDFPIELQAYLNQDDMMRVDLERSYNFQEGKYVINQQKSDEQLFKIKEEREYISELNERIFKLHKAIKEKQLEEQQFVRQSKTNDLNIMRHLDNLEQLTMSIFTNNTNIREIEMMGSELIDKIRGFKPQSTRELSIQITSKRLQQLSLEKIQSLKTYNELMGYKEEEQYELFSQVDDHQMNNLTHQIYDEEYIDKHPPPRSYSQSPDAKQRIQDQIFKSPQPKTDHINLISADQFMYLDEEQKKQKAELEVWRNLHNEILKNYLMTKGPLVQNKHIQEISSDVSSKNDQISDNSSQFSSNTGGASSVGSLFNQNFQQTKSLAPGLNYKGLSPNNNQNQDNQDMELLNEAEEALKFKENEDLKRHFYTLAIHNSKKILKSVPQGQILKNLYNKSKELRIEVNDWENFIQREFKYLRSSVQLV